MQDEAIVELGLFLNTLWNTSSVLQRQDLLEYTIKVTQVKIFRESTLPNPRNMTSIFQPFAIPEATTPKRSEAKLLALDPLTGEITPSSSPNTRPGAKYRGASVEDLQLPPAFALSKTQNVMSAIELAYDRDFSYLPILDKNRRPLGYIDVTALKQAWEAGEIDADDQVHNVATKFDRSSATGRAYTVITPNTPLEILEEFLRKNVFALVTDHERKFVLGVATMQDLENFVTRRGSNIF
ncbi:hypothetical protein FRC20_006029 [Serendipita sp. 405]|nr:hypothetical protein FRC15_005983 [Serendipita sp. 397]KAG8839463.1 hypothetical protein FRC20_006029 [Serendipita sp. 405]